MKVRPPPPYRIGSFPEWLEPVGLGEVPWEESEVPIPEEIGWQGSETNGSLLEVHGYCNSNFLSC